jgi:hypothetical protein
MMVASLSSAGTLLAIVILTADFASGILIGSLLAVSVALPASAVAYATRAGVAARRPPGIPLGLMAVAAAMAALWDSNGFPRGLDLFALALVGSCCSVWIVRLIAFLASGGSIDRARQLFRWGFPVVLVVASWVAMSSGVAFQARFELSRDAFDRQADRAVSGSLSLGASEQLGLLSVQFVSSSGPEVSFVLGSDLHEQWGVTRIPSGSDQQRPADTGVWRRLDDRWWYWERSTSD